MIYLTVAILLVLLSLRYDINGKERYKLFCYHSMMILLILIAGLRYRLGIDTPNYLNMFYRIFPSLDEFHWKDYPFGEDPLYVLINSIVKSLGGRFYVVQLIQATFVNILVFRYIKKHTPYLFTTLFFYFTIYCYFEFNMEIMRGGMSIVICLFANDYILERKWIKGYFLYLVACLFHGQTIVMLVMPLLLFVKFNKKGLVVLALSFLAGKILQVTLADYLELLEMADMDSSLSDKASTYAESDNYGTQSGNVYFILVNIFPWLAYGIASVLYMKRNYPDNHILKLESFVLIGMIFLVMQINLQIAYRFVDYYRLYFILFFSETFVHLLKRGKAFSLSLSYARAVFLFIPLFMLIGYLYFTRSYQYFPYSSVIERRLDSNRETLYMSKDGRPKANLNEY